jgi:hypothetical protein
MNQTRFLFDESHMNFTLKSASFKKDFESNDTKRHRMWKGFLKKDPTGHSEQDTPLAIVSKTLEPLREWWDRMIKAKKWSKKWLKNGFYHT